MKKTLTLFVLSLMVLAVLPTVLAVSSGIGIGVDIETEDFPPQVWMCDHRVVYDDNTEPGRLFQTDGINNCTGRSYSGDEDGESDCQLLERTNNYAFEGEQISWTVLVFDKNGVEKIKDVYITAGASQSGEDGSPEDIEANCQLIGMPNRETRDSCNARILEEQVGIVDAVEDGIAQFYKCLLTVETPESMYGEYWVTVEAEDLDGLFGNMDENEYWFFNPIVALSIEGDLAFSNVRPGTASYSDTLLVGNDADAGSGVMLDMFISGTDFYDSSNSGAKCPTTNQLALKNFRYFATNGAYSTSGDLEIGRAGLGVPGPDAGDDSTVSLRDKDAEGYVDIGYGIGFNNPTPFYDGFEIIQAGLVGPYYAANTLAPGAEMALTFKLSLPEPCNGDFDTGAIWFWGEAI